MVANMRRRKLLRAMWGTAAGMVSGVPGTTRASAQQSSTDQASSGATPEPDLQRFSEEALRVLFFARRAVSNLGGQSVTCAHLLIGVTHVEPHLLNAVLAAGWDAERLRTRILSLLESSPRFPEDADVPLSSGLMRALHRATMGLSQRTGDTRTPVRQRFSGAGGTRSAQPGTCARPASGCRRPDRACGVYEIASALGRR